jgi:hypothetical protein
VRVLDGALRLDLGYLRTAISAPEVADGGGGDERG